MTPDWTAIRDEWSEAWEALAQSAQARFAALLASAPERAIEPVRSFLALLDAIRADLNRMALGLTRAPAGLALADLVTRHARLQRRYLELSAGLLADARPIAASPEVGVAPIVLVVAGVGLTAVGVSWAVAAYEYAVNLREQTALAVIELEARLRAHATGRELQGSTLALPAAPPPPPPSRSMTGLLVLGALALTAGVLVLRQPPGA